MDAIIHNKHCRMLIDTGAHYSCMDTDFTQHHNIHVETSSQTNTPQLLSAKGKRLTVIGLTSANVSIIGYMCILQFVVIADLYIIFWT